MNITTWLIINSVALGVLAVLVVLLTAGMLRAEWKVYRLGGKSWAFRTPKGKGGEHGKR